MSDQADQLLSQVREAAQGFDVFGELGRKSDADIWYLARDQTGGQLVALRLHRVGEGGEASFDLAVARDLDDGVPLGEGFCPFCRAELRNFARFCTHCGVDLTVADQFPKTAEARAALTVQVRQAAGDLYDVLGEMPWSHGAGIVYFAIEKATGRLARLRLKFEEGEMALGETVAQVPLLTKARVSAAYTTSTALPQVRISRREGSPQPPASAAPPAQPGPAAPKPAPADKGLRGLVSKLWKR